MNDLDHLTDDDLDVRARKARADANNAGSALEPLRRKPTREEAHAGVDAFVADAARRYDALLERVVPRLAPEHVPHKIASHVPPDPPSGLADAWVVVADPAIAKRLHELIDRESGLSLQPRDMRQRVAKVQGLGAEAAPFEAEQRQRAEARAAEQAEAAADAERTGRATNGTITRQGTTYTVLTSPGPRATTSRQG